MMRLLTVVLAAAFVTLCLACGGGDGKPTNSKGIFEKIKAGEELTPDELETMKKVGKEMREELEMAERIRQRQAEGK